LAHERKGKVRLLTLATLFAATSLLLLHNPPGANAARHKKHRPVHSHSGTVAPDPKTSHSASASGTRISDPLKTGSTKTVADPDKSAAAKLKDEWSESDIAAAKADCATILKRIHAVAVEHKPIKHGACGAPAPMELISIGTNPEVSLSPPVIVRCALAESLVNWLEQDLQPLAQKHFHSKIVKIETMGSYSCRNAPRRKRTKLSEHGLANAVDIGDFVMASHKTADVRKGWGTPKRVIAAQLAAEKAAAEKAAAEKAGADKAAQKNLSKGNGGAGARPPPAEGSTIGAPAAGIAHSKVEDGKSKLTVTIPGAVKSDRVASLSGAGSQRLGGPPQDEATGEDGMKPLTGAKQHSEAEPYPETKAFLHEAHAAACRIFGTTLGPEANADHRNHFHVDMAPRKYKKICD
jgi:hypothetical protein